MADDVKPTERMEGTGEVRRTQQLTRSRDVTGEVSGYVFVGGIPPSVIAKLKAGAKDEPEEPGDDHVLDDDRTPDEGGRYA